MSNAVTMRIFRIVPSAKMRQTLAEGSVWKTGTVANRGSFLQQSEQRLKAGSSQQVHNVEKHGSGPGEHSPPARAGA
jgi:hypothetical protein